MKERASNGQRHGPALPIEESGPHFPLERMDVSRERGLRKMQLLRCPCKRKLLGHRGKAFQLAQRIIHTETVS